MNDQPSLLVEFDPENWQVTAVYFKASTDEETKRLREILMEGLKTEALTTARGAYNA